MLRLLSVIAWPWSIIWVAISGTARAGGDESLAGLRQAASRGTRYLAPDEAELKHAQGLFRRTIEGVESFEPLRLQWAQLHWDLLSSTLNGEEILVLREQDGHLRGRGFFAFRRKRVSPIALQAPHSVVGPPGTKNGRSADAHTGRLTELFFQECGVQAAAWNTVHPAVVDLADQPRSYLNEFTTAFLQVYPSGCIAQIHGFDQAKRETAAGHRAAVIVSNGTKRPSSWFQRCAADAWKHFQYGPVLIFPAETAESLGGTRNSQARTARAVGADRFLHLELSQSLRKELSTDASLRARFVASIEACCRQ
jgi:hypothetical protein